MLGRTYPQFMERVKEINLATSIEGLLEWDQETYMPPKAAPTRAAQLAFVAGLAHERLIDRKVGKWLEKLEAEGHDDVAITTNIREVRRAYERKTRLPTKLVRDIAATVAIARQEWALARKESDFARFAPHLEKLLELKREVAQRIGSRTEPYDALMDEYEPDAKAKDVEHLFEQVKTELVPLVQAIRGAPRQPNTSLLERHCPQAAQAEFGRQIVAAMGFDLGAGRIDLTTHPFCNGASPLDVRLANRYDEHCLAVSMFGIMHEAGHGLYEQGLDVNQVYTPMGQSISLGIHESQSRTWENIVGRSRAFWAHWLPLLHQAFPSLAGVSLDDWYFAINAVRPSFIRVEADEVTYNLHIMLRFQIERQLISGKLAVREVPACWNDTFRQMLGITPPDDAHGCLQDIHWSIGIFGYFPTYALGNLYAAQFFEAARAAMPDLDDRIARGELLPLREWQRENIHRHGRQYRAHELVERVTGRPLSPAPFIEYLKRKYGPLYGF